MTIEERRGRITKLANDLMLELADLHTESPAEARNAAADIWNNWLSSWYEIKAQIKVIAT